MENEIMLTGGRITQGVVRIGDHVHRPQCEKAGFVHAVLEHLKRKGISCAPKFIGIDEKNREILTYMKGDVPDNLGEYSAAQCAAAARIIRTLHDALADFPDCPNGMTVCHNDLSPCNFVFAEGIPAAVIDWDAAKFGEALDDLAYAAWMWLDIGNEENDPEQVCKGISAMLSAYGAEENAGLCSRMLKQMERVGQGIFPTEELTIATRQWTESCSCWLKVFMKKYPEL